MSLDFSTSDNRQAYTEFGDRHVQAYLPNKDTEPLFHELFVTYQKHTHSKTCKKYKNIPFRFNFGKFYTYRTIVAEPLSNDLCADVKTGILTRRASILGTVKSKIDKILNPSKSEYISHLTAAQVLTTVDISEQDYYWALSVSAYSEYELHLKRSTDSCFINNYFVAGIQGFAANVDSQPVFNHYKCITYMSVLIFRKMKLSVNRLLQMRQRKHEIII